MAVNSVGLKELLFEAARLLLDWRKVPGVVLCIVLPQCDDLVKCEKWDALEEDVELDLKKIVKIHISKSKKLFANTSISTYLHI